MESFKYVNLILLLLKPRWVLNELGSLSSLRGNSLRRVKFAKWSLPVRVRVRVRVRSSRRITCCGSGGSKWSSSIHLCPLCRADSGTSSEALLNAVGCYLATDAVKEEDVEIKWVIKYSGEAHIVFTSPHTPSPASQLPLGRIASSVVNTQRLRKWAEDNQDTHLPHLLDTIFWVHSPTF